MAMLIKLFTVVFSTGRSDQRKESYILCDDSVEHGANRTGTTRA